MSKKGGAKVELVPDDEHEDFEGGDFDMDSLGKALSLEKLASLPKSVQKRVRALKNLHKDFFSLEHEYRKEVRALELKYEKLYDPIFKKRATIVTGAYEPTEDESKFEDEADAEALQRIVAKVEEAGSKIVLDESASGIPLFWHTVLMNNRLVSEMVFENDEDALSFLKDIQCKIIEGGDDQGFVLDFHFAENPYFTNAVLKKTYYLIEDDSSGDLVFDHAEGTKIDWKSGKNLTVKLVTKKPPKSKPQKGGKKGPPPKPKIEQEPLESFFNFFSPIDPEGEEEDEEGMLEDLLEADFEVGCILKDRLVRQSVLWYTGEAVEFDDYDEDGSEFGEAEDDEEDEDEDEEEEEEPPKKGGKGLQSGPKGHGGHDHKGHSHSHNHGPAAPAPAQPAQPECKQQ